MGPGAIAHTFARAVASLEACEIVAVGSRDTGRARAFAEEHNVPVALEGYQALAEHPEVEAVYVATPHSAHRDAALLAIAAGKHVLVEKSFTRNAAEAREVVDAARAAGVFCMEAMWTRFLPRHVVVRHLARSGALGEIVQVSADLGHRLAHVPRMREPELAGGALLDLGVYPISFIVSLLGCPTSVTTFGSHYETGVDAGAAVHLAFDGSTAAGSGPAAAAARATATATTTMVATTPKRAWVAGTEGFCDLDPDFHGPGGLTVDLGWPGGAVRWDGPAEDRGGFEFQIAEVARRVAAGETESPIMPLDETVAIMELMDGVRRDLGVIFPGE
ncbi:MAG TPA: Gfo/Idh/MocA family oxidoreductase [Actinomycetales bacterium]|nr:Gfo/Idh/MocA family oxidoreductase [Actinomycetales bacterium]